jgi:hypothetical protein
MFEELDVLSEGLEVSGAKVSLMEVSKRFFLIKTTRIFLTELFSVLIFKKTWIRAPDPDSTKRLDLDLHSVNQKDCNAGSQKSKAYPGDHRGILEKNQK